MRQQILEVSGRKRAADEVERLKRHNGPCSNSADVRNLLKTYCKKGQQLLAVQAELSTTAPFSREKHLSYKYQRRCHSSLRTRDSSLEVKQNPVQRTRRWKVMFQAL